VIKRSNGIVILCAIALTFYHVSTKADSVEEVVHRAISTHPKVAAAMADIKAKQADKRGALSNYLPTVTLTGDTGREYTDNELRDSLEQDRYQARLEVRQPIYKGGFSKSQLQGASAELRASIYKAEALVEEFSLEVIQAYLDVVKSKELVVLAQENLDMHYRTREKVNLRHASGIGDRADVAQINGRISRATANLNNAQNELMDARSLYISLVGSLPIRTIRPKPDLAYVPKSVSRAQEIALARNPDILRSIEQVEVAKQNLNAQRSKRLPTLDLVVDGGVRNDVAGWDGKQEDVSAVLEFNWKLYQGGSVSNAKRSSAAKYSESKYLSNSTRRDVLQRVDLVWSSHLRSKQNIKLLHDYVIYSKDSESLYYDQFQVNRRSLLDLLDSANELFEARQSFLEAEFRLIRDQYRLMQVMGVLAESLHINMPQTVNNNLTNSEVE